MNSTPGLTRRAYVAECLLAGPLPIGGLVNIVIEYDRAIEGKCAGMLRWGQDSVYALAVLSDGTLASGSFDGHIRIWANQHGTRIMGDSTDIIRSLTALPMGKILSGSRRGIGIWDNGALVQSIGDGTSGYAGLAYIPPRSGESPGKLLGVIASGAWDTTVRIWDTNGICLCSLAGHPGLVRALVALPDGILAAASKNTIHIWYIYVDQSNKFTGVCLRVLVGHVSRVYALAAIQPQPGKSPTLLASGGQDNTIRIWNIAMGVCLRELIGHTNEVTALVSFPNGILASGSRDRTIRIWYLGIHGSNEVEAAECLAVIEGHTDVVSSLAVLPNGLLASGSWDKTIRIWE
jgi:WD40 repeat protein